MLSAANEEELTQWIQALCLAAVESKVQLHVKKKKKQKKKTSFLHVRYNANFFSPPPYLQMVDSPTHSRKTYSFCAILLTKNKVPSLCKVFVPL